MSAYCPPLEPHPLLGHFNSLKYFFILGLGLDPSREARGAEMASHPTLGPLRLRRWDPRGHGVGIGGEPVPTCSSPPYGKK